MHCAWPLGQQQQSSLSLLRPLHCPLSRHSTRVYLKDDVHFISTRGQFSRGPATATGVMNPSLPLAILPSQLHVPNRLATSHLAEAPASCVAICYRKHQCALMQCDQSHMYFLFLAPSAPLPPPASSSGRPLPTHWPRYGDITSHCCHFNFSRSLSYITVSDFPQDTTEIIVIFRKHPDLWDLYHQQDSWKK